MISLYRNEFLFSEIYLEKLTRFREKPEVISSLATLKDYLSYADSSSLEKWKTSFIQIVFGVLGFNYSASPDNLIRLFVRGDEDKVISICFALPATENLDNTHIGTNWSEKIISLLKKNDLQWGILTNGNLWRIYHLDEPAPYETYIEIDLRAILHNADTASFMIFYEFMKAENFLPGEDGKCKFDEFKKDSFAQIEYIEDELKRALKQREGEKGKGVLNDLCMGYVDYLRSQGKNDFSDSALRNDIYAGAMHYMFRLLFMFYASSRDLLDIDEIKQFRALLTKAASYHSASAPLDSFELWLGLRDVFSFVDEHYNGGLFDPSENNFIENNRVADYYLVNVINNLNTYEDDDGQIRPVSFRDMGVRHLGTLYEDLLEHKLFIAEENMQVKIEKGTVRFIGESEGGKLIEGNYIKKGTVYFAGDKGERKSTGSYYTPEYIVEYIVNNTVGEKLNELRSEFTASSGEILAGINAAPTEAERNRLLRLFEDNLVLFVKTKILKLSVLDPAMGSGHFLVNAANKISNFITRFLNDFEVLHPLHSGVINSPGKSAIDTSSAYWRRRVVENCIYGVDINSLAVELAKLSLWILSMAKDAHLSFLNHHLKCGNSLIGARLSDIGIFPGYKTKTAKAGYAGLFDHDLGFKETVGKVISDYLAIEQRETVSKDDIEFKKELFHEIKEVLKPYKKVCDYHTSLFFGNDVDETEYFAKIKKPDSIKTESNNYFHWELEFPEIFKAFSGFDCVVGNPPYVTAYESRFSNFFPLTYGTRNLFCYFTELALRNVSAGAYHSFIVPLSGFAMLEMEPYQNLILKSSNTLYVANFSWRPGKVFEDANIPVSIFIIKIIANPKDSLQNLFTTHYLRWYKNESVAPISKVKYIESKKFLTVSPGFIPKIGDKMDVSILNKVLEHNKIEKFITKKEIDLTEKIYYRSKGGLYYKIFTNFYAGSTNEIAFRCKNEEYNPIVIAVLNSNIFFWFYEIFSSCRVVNYDNIKSFRLDIDRIPSDEAAILKKLASDLMSNFKQNAEIKVRHYSGYGNKECYTIYARKSKSILDDIDKVLGRVYGLSQTEIDYVSNYMINYRVDENPDEK